MYTRRVLSGEFALVNPHLIRELEALGQWPALKQELVAANGSVANLPISDELKRRFRTVWEIPQRVLLDLAIDRAPFIDQSQSLNVFMAQPSFAKLTSMHFYGWRAGLKTGMYYLRTQASVDAIKFTVDTKVVQGLKAVGDEKDSADSTPTRDSNLQGALDTKLKPGAESSKASAKGAEPVETDFLAESRALAKVAGSFCRREADCLVCSS
jgi:ribonucleoside-diphosphate reductase subunit M1